jgi:hypothetical protein
VSVNDSFSWCHRDLDRLCSSKLSALLVWQVTWTTASLCLHELYMQVELQQHRHSREGRCRHHKTGILVGLALIAPGFGKLHPLANQRATQSPVPCCERSCLLGPLLGFERC